MNAEPTAKYDAGADAERLLVTIRKWAGMGFLRGFAGIRQEILPKGKMSLPSAAFHEAAVAGLDELTDEAEVARRRAYIDEVESKLRETQASAINEHFRKAALGQVADAALGFFVIALTIGLLWRVGPFNPLTFVFLILFAAKLAFMHFTVRKMLNAATKAFKSHPDDIVLPWKNS